MASDNNEESKETFAEALLGKELVRSKWLKKLQALPGSYRVVGAIALFAGLLYIPYVGAVGLWDPWETNYGEVARQMVHRHDYLYPYYEDAWFLSKPPLTMWLETIGMHIVGTNRTVGALALYTEWGMRLPFVLLSITALCLLGLAVYRVGGRRAGYASAFVLGTMPLYWLLTRQAVTDTPFVSTLMGAMACAIIGQLDDKTKHRAAWWYGFYIFCGFSTLAKGLLGFGLPAVVLVLYACLCVVPWQTESFGAHARWLFSSAFQKEVNEGKRPMPFFWAQFYRMKLGTGVLVFFGVCALWYGHMFAFKGVDEDGVQFWYRFLIHDHLNRLAAGVHTTTPGGSFIYFIEQGGYAMFPWVALLPGALAVVSRSKVRGGTPRDHLALIATIWALFAFALVGLSATKFHHYVFPVLPAAAILIGLFVDHLWEEGVPRHAVSLMFGFVLFVMVGKDLSTNPKDFTDLFVYNYDRPYPFDLVEKPLSFFGQRSLMMWDVVSVLLLAFGLYFLGDAFRVGELFRRKDQGKADAAAEKKDGAEAPGTPQQPTVGARAAALALTLSGVSLLLSRLSQDKLGPTLGLGLGLALVTIYLGYSAARAPKEDKPGLITSAGLLFLVSAALVLAGLNLRMKTSGATGLMMLDPIEAALTQTVNTKLGLGLAFTVGGALCTLAALMRARTMLFASFWGLAFAFALWFNWGHWVDLSHQWTQRDLMWRYYRMRGSPDEPLAAFLMHWHGETFYTRNAVKQIKDNGVLARFAALPGRKWALVEHNRFGILKSAVGPDKTVTPINPDLNNKFVLVKIE